MGLASVVTMPQVQTMIVHHLLKTGTESHQKMILELVQVLDQLVVLWLSQVAYLAGHGQLLSTQIPVTSLTC
jgi:hypothetical protein